MNNKYSKEIENSKQEFVSTMNGICMSIDITNVYCGFFGDKLVKEDIFESDLEPLVKTREFVSRFEKLLNDKNEIIVRYILERSIGKPFYIIVKSPDEEGVAAINSPGELFDFLYMLKEIKKDDASS